MSPWHYLGAGPAEKHYVRRHGRLPKNRPGMGLHPVHVGPTLRLLRSRTDVEILDCLPRYYPRWCRPLVTIPGLREVATWNLLVIMRQMGPAVRPRPREGAGTGTFRPSSLEAPWRR
jgi:hypothetical protein